MGQRLIGVAPHLAAERIDLTRQMPLCRPPNGAVTRQMPDAIQSMMPKQMTPPMGEDVMQRIYNQMR